VDVIIVNSSLGWGYNQLFDELSDGAWHVSEKEELQMNCMYTFCIRDATLPLWFLGIFTVYVVTIPQIFIRIRGPITTMTHEDGCNPKIES
jgi:hypothetical protein